MTSRSVSKPLPLKGTFNTRELGGYSVTHGRTTLTHRCLRSDGLSSISAEDMDFLLDYGVVCVIDLRTAQECTMSPSLFAQENRVEYYHFPLLDQINLVIEGGSMPSTMDQMYIQILSQSQERLKEVLEQIAAHDEGTVLFNCSAGKDRTGIISMLLLGLAGVCAQDIVADYAISETYLEPLFNKQKAQISALGINIPEEVFRSDAESMEKTLNWLDVNYGGIRQYIHTLGLSPAVIIKLESKLLEVSA